MKSFKPFGPSLGKGRLSKKIIRCINKIIDKSVINKKNDYSPKLVSQIKNEIKLSNNFVKKNLSKELIKNIKKFLIKSDSNKIKEIKIINLWVIRQFKNEYNPVHFHGSDISGVGYLKVPKNLTLGKKKIKTNGTIDFINGTKSFMNNSIYNHIPKVGDMIFFPNNLMHTAYPFSVNGERRSFSFNLEIDKKISNVFND